MLDDESLTYYTRKGGARKGVFHITRATECACPVVVGWWGRVAWLAPLVCLRGLTCGASSLLGRLSVGGTTGEDASLRPFCFFLRNEERTLFLAADDMTQKDMWMEAVFRCRSLRSFSLCRLSGSHWTLSCVWNAWGSAIHIRRIGFLPGPSFDSRNSSSSDGSSATYVALGWLSARLPDASPQSHRAPRACDSNANQSGIKRVSMRRVEGIMKTARAKYHERPQLVVKIIQARNLLGKDMSGLSDPYVVCTVGNSTGAVVECLCARFASASQHLSHPFEPGVACCPSLREQFARPPATRT